MLYSIKGTLVHKDANFVVIECAGIGYKCSTTLTTLSKLPAMGQPQMLFTYLHVREDALDLFGFADLNEMNCFKMLISVSGVGPKVGLAILSELSPEKFALCVATADAKTITKSNGVGPKLAQRIILELKDKVENSTISSGITELSSSIVNDRSNCGEAIHALVVLGYAQSECAVALSKLDADLPVQELIKQGLKILSARQS